MKHLLLTTIAAVVLVGTALADPIHEAAANGDLAGVQAELDKGADVNAKDDFGFTPLDRAEKVEFWHLEAPREGDGRVYLPGDLNAAKEETAILIREHGGITYREDVEYKFNSLKEQLSRLKHLIIRDDAGVDPDKLSIEKLQGVFVIQGKVGGKYEVQYHTGDNNWQVREEITLSANRQLYIDSSSYDEKRFYRVKQLD